MSGERTRGRLILRPDSRRSLAVFAAALAMALVFPQLAAAARTSPATAESIGEVRGDSLHVTLDKVRSAALAHNEMLAAAGAMSDAAGAEALSAWRGFLPRLQVGEFYLRSDDPLNMFGFKLNKRAVEMQHFDPAFLNDPPIEELAVTKLLLRQPIFNGGSEIYGKQAADAMARAARHEHRRAAETVEFQAVQAYEGLVLARSFERVMGDAVAAAEGHAAQARALVAAEMATEADLLQAEVHLSAMRQRLIEVRNLVALAGEHIKLLTAVDTDLPLAAEHGFSAPETVPPPVAPPSPQDIEGRADVLARRQQAEAAARMVGVARGAMLPHLNLSLERNFYGEEIFSDDARSWTLGVYATWDLFAGLENIGGLKKARAQKRAAQHVYDFERRRARVEATQASLELLAAAEKVAVARGAVSAGREGLRIVTSQYREGLASMVDLLDTQAAATMAEGNLVQALHDYRVGLARLRFAGGAGGRAHP